jgi:tartrate dehydrogenase/decarboxylase/D-malate dehydrogenase
MMDADGVDRLRGFDAIYLGAIGDPRVPDHVSVWELILPLRQRYQQYVNLRPMRHAGGRVSARRPRTRRCRHDLCPGEFGGRVRRPRGRMHIGTPHEVAEQTGLFTRHGIDRIVRYAFGGARSRPRKLLASATKSNALQHSMVLWDEVVESVQKDYPDVALRKYHVDALAARMITAPQTIDVIVASGRI